MYLFSYSFLSLFISDLGNLTSTVWVAITVGITAMQTRLLLCCALFLGCIQYRLCMFLLFWKDTSGHTLYYGYSRQQRKLCDPEINLCGLYIGENQVATDVTAPFLNVIVSLTLVHAGHIILMMITLKFHWVFSSSGAFFRSLNFLVCHQFLRFQYRVIWGEQSYVTANILTAWEKQHFSNREVLLLSWISC